jgi:hypothetical protein
MKGLEKSGKADTRGLDMMFFSFRMLQLAQGPI